MTKLTQQKKYRKYHKIQKPSNPDINTADLLVNYTVGFIY